MSVAITEVIRRPIITEKAVGEAEKGNAYTFEIDPRATKADIRRAVEKMFNVRVVEVRTMAKRGKTRRTRFRIKKKHPDSRKAVVRLADGNRIDLF